MVLTLFFAREPTRRLIPIRRFSKTTEKPQPAYWDICGNDLSRELVLAGLATDFCVRFSAVDAAKLGFRVKLVEDACRAIDLDNSLEAAMTEMQDLGVGFVKSSALM